MFTNTAPRIYQDSEVFQGIHFYPDKAALDLDQKIESLRNFLDPALTDSRGLTFIATEILGLTTWFWADWWSEEWKRKTIQNYRKLVTERGNKSLLPWLFQLYSLTVTISNSQGWLLGVSVFPMQFSTPWNDLRLVLPVNYSVGTPERRMVLMIVDYFVPDIVTVAYA